MIIALALIFYNQFILMKSTYMAEKTVKGVEDAMQEIGVNKFVSINTNDTNSKLHEG